MSKLDDIINDEYSVLYHSFKTGDMEKQYTTFKPEAKKKIKDLFDELIGEDQPDPKLNDCCENEGGLLCFKESKQRAANKVKSELRQKVQEL